MIKKKQLAALIAASLSLCFTTSVFASRIILKSGMIIEGDITEQKDGYVTVDVNGNLSKYSLDVIETMIYTCFETTAPEPVREFLRKSEYKKATLVILIGKLESTNDKLFAVIHTEKFHKKKVAILYAAFDTLIKEGVDINIYTGKRVKIIGYYGDVTQITGGVGQYWGDMLLSIESIEILEEDVSPVPK